MTITLRRLTWAATLVLAGAAAFYVAPVAIRLARPEPAKQAPESIAAIDVPGAAPDKAGDVVLVNCLVALERRGAVEAEVVQTGTLVGQSLETSGVYRQLGRGEARRFKLLLQGRVGGAPSRLWQVSDGRFLWTDLSWGGAEQIDRRRVTRVDLRRLRAELTPTQDADELGPGEALAAPIDPSIWAGFGGLPMLLESLGSSFHFGAPRKMVLEERPVFVMVGRWRPARRKALTTAKQGDGSVTNPGAVARMPDHVVLALGAADLFPYLIEFRATGDTLAAARLPDDALLRPSRRPMLRMELRRPRFDTPVAAADFEYPAVDSVDWVDTTDTRLATLRRRQKLKIAARSGARR